MDSFYDAPRRLPMFRTPFRWSSPPNILPTHVPDVSMLEQNRGAVPKPVKAEMSYNAWKIQNNFGKENVPRGAAPESQASILRKQVRFESPQAPQRPPFAIENGPKPQVKESFHAPILNAPRSKDYIFPSKPIQRCYLSNVPNRNLDLSFADPPRVQQIPPQPFQRGYHMAESTTMESRVEHQPRGNHMAESTTMESRVEHQPRGYHMTESTSMESRVEHQPRFYHKTESTTLGYRVGHQPRRYNLTESTTLGSRVEHQPQQQRASDEPTIKDLMKIIQQQNEQLMCLQKQVSTLLEEKKEKAAMPQPIQLKTIDSKNGGLPKFAFDVMTSFEVSLRPPPANNNDYEGPKIQEIFEPVNVPNPPSRPTDLSLTLNEPIVMQEESHSPEQSIHVEMQDFSSESEDEDAPSNNSLIGWTIYNNVMDQVNHLLNNSPEQKQNQGGNTMQQVKQATLMHLKSVGVNLPNNVTSEDSNSSQCSPNDISFAVKQLLMKYLPDEQLAKVNINKGKQPRNKTKPNYPTNLINRRPEFSMATVQYMEKYNLLNKGKPSNKPQDNILDITALKQQPKLL